MGDNKDELFPLTDDKGYIKGHITRKEAHGGGGHIHPVVHLQIGGASRRGRAEISVVAGSLKKRRRLRSSWLTEESNR